MTCGLERIVAIAILSGEVPGIRAMAIETIGEYVASIGAHAADAIASSVAGAAARDAYDALKGAISKYFPSAGYAIPAQEINALPAAHQAELQILAEKLADALRAVGISFDRLHADESLVIGGVTVEGQATGVRIGEATARNIGLSNISAKGRAGN